MSVPKKRVSILKRKLKNIHTKKQYISYKFCTLSKKNLKKNHYSIIAS